MFGKITGLFRIRLELLLLAAAAMISTDTLPASQPLPRHAASMVASAKGRMAKVEQVKTRLMERTRKRAADDLQRELGALILAKDLDRAVSTRDLVRVVSEGEPLEQIPPGDGRYREDAANIVNSCIRKIQQIEQNYLANKQSVLADLERELSEEMVRHDRIGSIAQFLDVKAFLAQLKSPDFDLMTYKIVEQEDATEKKDIQSSANEIKVPADAIKHKHELVLQTALALGNNLLAEDAASEKGRTYFCFAENIAPDNPAIKALRRRIEQRLFLPVMPCQHDEAAFLELVASLCDGVSDDSPDLEITVKYALLMDKLDPKSRNAEPIAGLLKKSPGNAGFDAVFGFSQDIFGGSDESEDIKLQIEGAMADTIQQLIQKTEALREKHPRNEDVQSLLIDLRKIKPAVPEALPAAIPRQEITPQPKESKIPCTSCKGTGWAEEKCPQCPSQKTKDGVCQRCIGSGFVFEEVECDQCKGGGKNFFGITCKKCNGTGKVREKIPCPECQAANEAADCGICGSSGIVKRRCTDCNGTGQIEK